MALELRKKSTKVWVSIKDETEIIISKGHFRFNGDYFELTEPHGVDQFIGDAKRTIYTDIEVYDDVNTLSWTSFASAEDVALRLEALDAPFFNTASGGSGAATSLEIEVNQAAHGLSVGEALRNNGSIYVTAQADLPANSDVIGVVSEVVDVDNFKLQYSGVLTGSFTEGTNYFLSTTVAGAIVVEPTYSVGEVRQFIGTGIDGGSLLLNISIGEEITAVTNYLQNVVEDTTPQLGGELDTNNHSIGGDSQTATGDGTTTIDWKLGNIFDFTFGAFNEVFTFTAPTKSGTLMLKLVQDSVGSRTATFPASVKWAGGTAPTLTTTATTGTDIITFYYDGTNYWGVASLNFS